MSEKRLRGSLAGHSADDVSTCSGLLVEEERRRTTKAAHDMAAAPLPPLETFSQVRFRFCAL